MTSHRTPKASLTVGVLPSRIRRNLFSPFLLMFFDFVHVYLACVHVHLGSVRVYLARVHMHLGSVRVYLAGMHV